MQLIIDTVTRKNSLFKIGLCGIGFMLCLQDNRVAQAVKPELKKESQTRQRININDGLHFMRYESAPGKLIG